MDSYWLTSDGYDLQASCLIEMNVCRRVHHVSILMLDVDQRFLETVGAMTVGEQYRAHPSSSFLNRPRILGDEVRHRNLQSS